MALTVSLVVLLGIILLLLLRSRALGWGSATVATMFGFSLASTGAADPINTLTTTLIAALPNL
ncbi:hypothetical protein ACIQ7D_27045 [Streptomyces sp. NPDC096310]|uniref:hypothetical protein n=1 Tax=Streptomyces sp. NPDC096310 TaxID=3366082 RepID=UPI003827B44B